MIAESDMHRVDQGMAPAAAAGEVDPPGEVFPQKIDGSVDHLPLLFGEDQDLAFEAPAQAVC